MMLLKRLSTVNMKKDKCRSCCAMAFASLILLLLRVFICICKVLMSSDIVVVPKSDFEILPTKSKSSLFDLKDRKNVLCGGNVVVGMRW